MPSLIRVNMTTGNARFLPVQAGSGQRFGRLFNTSVLYTEMNPGAYSLGPESMLVLSHGLLVDQSLPFCDELFLTGKSPADGELHTVRIVSRAGRLLAGNAIKGVVIEGRSRTAKPRFLLIEKNRAELVSLPGIEKWSSITGAYTLKDRIFEAYGNGIAAIFCGPLAAENSSCSSLLVTGRLSSSLRNIPSEGLDTVLCSKGLCGIIIKVSAVVRNPSRRSAHFAGEKLSMELKCARGLSMEGTPFSLSSLCEACMKCDIPSEKNNVFRRCTDLGLGLSRDLLQRYPALFSTYPEAADFPAMRGIEEISAPEECSAGLDAIGLCPRAVYPGSEALVLECAAELSGEAAGSAEWNAEKIISLGRETLSMEKAFAAWAHEDADGYVSPTQNIMESES